MNSSIAFLYSIFLLEWKWHNPQEFPDLWFEQRIDLRLSRKPWFSDVFLPFKQPLVIYEHIVAKHCFLKNSAGHHGSFFSEKRELHRRGVPSPIHVHLVPTRQVSLAPIAASHYFLLTWRFEVALLEPQENLVGGWPTPLKNMSSSVGMMTFPKYGKIKFMFQTTNQKLNSYWQTVGVDLTALGPELLVRLERCF